MMLAPRGAFPIDSPDVAGLLCSLFRRRPNCIQGTICRRRDCTNAGLENNLDRRLVQLGWSLLNSLNIDKLSIRDV